MGKKRRSQEELERSESRARDFSKYLKEKMAQFNISATELAERTFLSWKSIYRYLNAENPPYPYAENAIRKFFSELELKMMEEDGRRYADEHDISDKEFRELIDRIEIKKQEYEFEDNFQAVVGEKTDLIAKGFGYLNHDTQKFVLKKFDLFCMINEEEMQLVKRLNRYDKNRYERAISYLENVPMDIGMLVADRDERVSKSSEYAKMLCVDPDEIPKNKYRQIEKGGKGTVSKETYRQLFEAVDNQERTGESVPADIMTRIKTVLDYTHKDWYLLFLYDRIVKSDQFSRIPGMLMVGNRRVGVQEEMFLNLLKILERRTLVRPAEEEALTWNSDSLSDRNKELNCQ